EPEPNPCGEEWIIEAKLGVAHNFDPDLLTFQYQAPCEGELQFGDTITIYPPGLEQCCAFKFYVPIIVPTATILGDVVVCVDDHDTYTLPLWPGMQYNWTINPSNAGTVMTG